MKQISDIHDIQTLGLYIFKNFQAFCEEYHLNYYCAYGTLLGTVRHKGFIPWDDDIDVWMKRDDYNRFLQYFPAWGKNHGFFLNHASTVSFYNRIFAQICMNNTEIKPKCRFEKYKSGMFIDVFPIDGTPDNSFLRWIRLTILQGIKIIGSIASYKPQVQNKDILKSFLSPFIRYIDTSWIMKKYDSIAAQNNPDKSFFVQTITNMKKGRNILFRRNVFSLEIKMEFEDMSVNIPIGYDEILTNFYYDYMQFPPVEEQIPHHLFDLFIDEKNTIL